MYESTDTEWDIDDSNTEYFSVGNKVQIDLADMDYKSWRSELTSDIEVLNGLMSMLNVITPKYDGKLQSLLKVISEKIENPININNKKVLIFFCFFRYCRVLI